MRASRQPLGGCSPWRAISGSVGLASLVLVAGCADLPEVGLILEFDTAPLCDPALPSCLNVDTETLDVQGARVIYKRVPGHPLVGLRLSFETVDAPSARQLWAETLAFTLFEKAGPRGSSSSDWPATLQALGASVSAGAGVDAGAILATMPAPHWRAVWDLVVEGLTDPRNPEGELDHWRRSEQIGFSTELDDPEQAADVYAWSRLFGGQLYNRKRERLDALESLTPADILAAWGVLRDKRRLLVTVVGDVERDELIRAVETSFGAFPDAAAPFGENDPPAEPPPGVDSAMLPYPGSPTWHISSYFHGPSVGSADYAALELGLAVLDQRLFDEVRDVRGLAYTTGASLSFSRETFGELWLTSESPREALAVAHQVITELQTSGPSDAELGAARSSWRTLLLLSSATPTGIASMLSRWQVQAGSREAVDAYLLALDAVGSAEASLALQTYLRDVKIAAAGSGGPLEHEDLDALFVSP